MRFPSLGLLGAAFVNVIRKSRLVFGHRLEHECQNGTKVLQIFSFLFDQTLVARAKGQGTCFLFAFLCKKEAGTLV